MLRLLLIGPMPPPIGGTTVSFRQLVDGLEGFACLKTTVLNTSIGGYTGPVRRFTSGLRTVVQVLRKAASHDLVSLHASPDGILGLAPPILGICRLTRTRLMIRVFGGNIDRFYERASPAKKWALRLILKNCTVLLQTRGLLQWSRALSPGGDFQWFANSRPVRSGEGKRLRKGPRRFVYVGHVKPTKGIAELVDAAWKLREEGVTVDVYGPLLKGMEARFFKGHSNVTYHGVVEPECIPEIIARYDCLVLATYHEGEGYPGVILEAYACGIPVIATDWMHIPEIVTHGVTGLLVEPRNSQALADAMLAMARGTLYETVVCGASRKALEYADDLWIRRFVEMSEDAVRSIAK